MPAVSAAVPDTKTVPLTMLATAGWVMARVGGVVSGLFTEKASTAVLLSPAASVARAVRAWLPLASEPVASGNDHEVVPLALWKAPPSTDTATEDTEPLSAAVPATATVPLTVAPAAGEVMAM